MPFADSEELVRKSRLSASAPIEVGDEGPAGAAGRLGEGDESIHVQRRKRAQDEALAFPDLAENLFLQLVLGDTA
jgi:hypothetical protein